MAVTSKLLSSGETMELVDKFRVPLYLFEFFIDDVVFKPRQDRFKLIFFFNFLTRSLDISYTIWRSLMSRFSRFDLERVICWFTLSRIFLFISWVLATVPMLVAWLSRLKFKFTILLFLATKRFCLSLTLSWFLIFLDNGFMNCMLYLWIMLWLSAWQMFFGASRPPAFTRRWGLFSVKLWSWKSETLEIFIIS